MKMVHYKMLLPEHVNNNGVLFGGNLLKWIDEFAYITVSLHFPGNRFVTIGLDNVVFKEPIDCGRILCFEFVKKHLGNSSLTYCVDVFYADEPEDTRVLLFETNITFVNLSDEGQPLSIRRP